MRVVLIYLLFDLLLKMQNSEFQIESDMIAISILGVRNIFTWKQTASPIKEFFRQTLASPTSFFISLVVHGAQHR